MKIIYNRFIPFKGFIAINLFGTLFVRQEKGKPEPYVSPRTINHESIHTEQMKELGYIFFYIWYFIEFKNQKISKAKDSVTKKAYLNWFWLVDILYEMSEKNNMKYDTFNYDNPILFAREKVVFILVVSEDKNIVDADKMRKCILAGEKFQYDYIKKLEQYIFKEAYIYTPQLLETYFVKKFKY